MCGIARPSTTVGELPLSVVRLLSNLKRKYMGHFDPGFTLPANIGDLDPAITELDLGFFGLRGM